MTTQSKNKILDLMKEKYGLSRISKTITITPKDTLYTTYRKTARYLYKNGIENGDYTEKDEIKALAHNLNTEENEIKKVNSSQLAPQEKLEFEKMFKFKNTKEDKWENHIYQVQNGNTKTFIFIKPNGSLSSTYYGKRRYWKDTNDQVKLRSSLSSYYNDSPFPDTTPWLTRQNTGNGKVFFTAYSRDLLIGYDKLTSDIKDNFTKTANDKAQNKTYTEQFNTLIDDLMDPSSNGKTNNYKFSSYPYYEIFEKESHTPSYKEWKDAPANSLLKLEVKQEDVNQRPKDKTTIEKELSQYLIKDNHIIPKSRVSRILAKNQAIDFTNHYLKNTYNLTLQQQYDMNQEKTSHAKFFQTKKNIDKATQIEMIKLDKDLAAYFKKVEIDNDVDLNQLKQYIPDLQKTMSVLPYAKEGTKPILRFRKLKNHKALGMFTPINNTLAIDFRYDKDTKSTGLQSLVHEYGHFLDYNYNEKHGLPLSVSSNFSNTLHSTQSEIDNNPSVTTNKQNIYLKTPSEVFARAFELYASNNGLNNSTIKDKENYNNNENINYSTFTPDIRKKLFSYFDNQFPNMKQKIQELSTQKGLSKREINRQAFLISRGRMKPSKNTKIIAKAKEFQNRWAMRRGEISKKELAKEHAKRTKALNLER